jgi:hypothetical protein
MAYSLSSKKKERLKVSALDKPLKVFGFSNATIHKKLTQAQNPRRMNE